MEYDVIGHDKYGLYNSLGAQKQSGAYSKQLRYILNFSDGSHDLVDIANMLEQPLWECETAVNDLVHAGLLRPLG
ncbi:MAG: hypothetical protein HZB51_20910 [Chloroflexi bacterium]|nr:hypothetical protein [Chloroflexota bacterium]